MSKSFNARNILLHYMKDPPESCHHCYFSLYISNENCECYIHRIFDSSIPQKIINNTHKCGAEVFTKKLLEVV